jgi:hypothetical protein
VYFCDHRVSDKLSSVFLPQSFKFGSVKPDFKITFERYQILLSSSFQPFTSITEVVAHLGATGPDGNSNYTVYGLTIAQATVQAHVDHANKYLSSLVSTLLEGSGDARLASAELAALDIACLGILVTVVGGSLVGATDYSLADLHVNRTGPYAFAIKTAINGYSRSAAANLANLSTVGVACVAKCARYVPRYHTPNWEP